MSLPDVLSALRILILDNPNFPASGSQRVVAFHKAFPRLSLEEIEDLAKIPDEKLEIYRGTIFSGERAQLRTHLALTWERAIFALSAIRQEKIDTFRLMQEIHSRFPWTSQQTMGLLQGFVQFLESQRDFLLPIFPELLECAQFELVAFELARSSGQAAVFGGAELQILKKLTVEQLLQFRFRLSPLVALRRFHFHFPQLLAEQIPAGEKKPPAADRGEFLMICSRNHAGSVFWSDLSSGIFEFLSVLRGEGELEELAGIYLEEFAQSENGEKRDEVELFQNFFQLVVSLASRGAIEFAAMKVSSAIEEEEIVCP